MDLNATQAAIRAGYSPNTAATQGHENLRKPEIQQRIAENRAAVSQRTGVTMDRVVQELAAVGFGRLDEVAPWDESGPHLIPSDDLPEEKRALIQSVKAKREREWRGPGEAAVPWEVETIEIKLWDKLAALDKLMRHLGGYAPEKQDVAISGKVKIRVEYTDADR